MTRDENIYEDKSKMKVRELVQKYGLSKRRILAICREQMIKDKLNKSRQDTSFYRGKYFNALTKGDSPNI